MWQARTLGEIMYACIIMHNMIVEDERERLIKVAMTITMSKTALLYH
jgi:hypothetical protein